MPLLMPPTPTPTPPPTLTPTLTLVEEGITIPLDLANSGSLCPKYTVSEDTGGPPSYIGERDDYDCEGFWTFNLQQIPARAKIISATFIPGTCTKNGKPFTEGQGTMMFAVVSVGTLTVADYGDFGIDGISLADNLTDCPSSFDVTRPLATYLNKGKDRFQIRAHLLGSFFGNGRSDYVSYRGGEPSVLIVRYQIYR